MKGPFRAGCGADRARLAEIGFEGNAGQSYTVSCRAGALVIAVGAGKRDRTSPPNGLRDLGAAVARAASQRSTQPSSRAELEAVEGRAAGQALAEGIVARPATALPSIEARSTTDAAQTDDGVGCRVPPVAQSSITAGVTRGVAHRRGGAAWPAT